ncbi:MAG TPA: DUF1684 domain-containing protein [Actinomycetota bacterium]|nr:DUF1684 domain-containing protein [Actinomycetota bacterium]
MDGPPRSRCTSRRTRKTCSSRSAIRRPARKHTALGGTWRSSGRRRGRVVVDFNDAYNPYCAYNPECSCPLPPAENWLSVAVRAGETAFEAEPSGGGRPTSLR